MDANRLRWGAVAWVLTLQFFVAETIAQLRLDVPYSRLDDVISDLGAAESPAAALMNASFVLQAVLIVAGVLLLRPALLGGGGTATVWLLEIAAFGVLLVGVFPSDGNFTLHAVGATLHLLGSGLGLIALAYAVRPRSEALGTTLALLGLIGTATSVFFLTGVVQYLGEGGTERAAAYVLPIGLTLAGVGLWRLRAADPTAATNRRAARRGEREQLREQARAERAEQARARDAALEAATRRERADDSDSFDPEDPWAPPTRDGR